MDESVSGAEHDEEEEEEEEEWDDEEVLLRAVQEEDAHAEQVQVQLGMARSEKRSTALPAGSLVWCSKETFATLEQQFEHVQKTDLAVSDVTWCSAQDKSILCTGATSILMMPFSFWPTEDKESPARLAQMLLSKRLDLDGSDRAALWERAVLPKETAELSLHFRQLLGFEGSEMSPVQRLRMTDLARTWMFGSARLWADTRSGDVVGKQCEWTDVQMVIFPHGAIVSIVVDWNPQGLTLADLRNWIYVAKFRSVRLGLLRGWSFARKANVSGVEAEERQECFGTTLFSALYGGSCVSLSSIASWLIALPGENVDETRTSGFENCVHYTGACLNRPWKPEDEEERDATSDKESFLWLRATCLIELSLEEMLGLEWGPKKLQKQFLKQLVGVYGLLAQHCLSERTTLERLSFLAALVARRLPTPDRVMVKADKSAVRSELTGLAMMLARYSSSMASDDCGGRAEFREIFAAVRRAYGVGLLKSELRGDLRDTLAMVESDRVDEHTLDKRREQLYKKRVRRLEEKKSRIRIFQKRYFEILVYTSIALATPFLVVCGVFGMNNNDLPIYVPWGYLLLGCGVASLLLLLVMVSIFVLVRPKLERVHAEEALLKEIKNGEFRKPSHNYHPSLPRQPDNENRGFMRRVTFIQ